MKILFFYCGIESFIYFLCSQDASCVFLICDKKKKPFEIALIIYKRYIKKLSIIFLFTYHFPRQNGMRL